MAALQALSRSATTPWRTLQDADIQPGSSAASPGPMPTTDLLKQFNLKRNPYTDRTAEKTRLDGESKYTHSDLQGFTPSETTYIFFGRRGSGKTTIRMEMQAAYEEHNSRVQASGKSRGHFTVDLCRPGHLTNCLRAFRDAIRSTEDAWDAQFGDSWHSADIVDCILSYAATELVNAMTDTATDRGKEMLDRVRADPRASKQMLLLAHLYAKTDAASLAKLRRELLRPKYSVTELAVGAGIGTTVAAGVTLAARDPQTASWLTAPFGKFWEELERAAPAIGNHPRAVVSTLTLACAAGAAYYARYQRLRSKERAAALISSIRIVKPQPVPLIAALLDHLFSSEDRLDTIRGLYIGISAHQKLEHLTSLVRLLGFESVAVFGDCFDEVGLLDPVLYPGAMKAFAKEICRNDLLNFGRLHFFFPDSRLALDLNTDKTLKEARFDRHFCRDLTWSRHQLEELAERRFLAAQQAKGAPQGHVSPADEQHQQSVSEYDHQIFQDMFKKVAHADFSSYLAKLQTPRELMIMMSELIGRLEANPEKGLEAQDMEIAVNKALEQAV